MLLLKFGFFKINQKKNFFKSFSAFCFIYFLGGVEMSFVIVFFNQFLNNFRIAWLFGAFIASLNNYFGSKYFLFRE
tara:strand:- start:30 stop:257 length:228 start_codon:yes stop_codon:yes gene_type:complete